MRASLSRVSTVSASASRAALPDWQRREEPFTGAGLMVRIRFPPAVSLRTLVPRGTGKQMGPRSLRRIGLRLAPYLALSSR